MDGPLEDRCAARCAIFLIGFMGVGKSTVGPLVARALRQRFVDLDELIEARAGQPIGELFRALGEDGFRRLESAALSLVAQDAADPPVVAAGGGAPTVAQNLRTMRAAGPIVLLTAGVDTLVTRLTPAAGRPSRPLLSALRGDRLAQEVAGLCERRASAYAQADLVVDTTGLAPEQVADQVVAGLLALDRRRGAA